MAYNVKFMKGTQANYDALATGTGYDDGTLYFVTGTSEGQPLSFYLGSKKIADLKALTDVIAESGTNKSDLTKLKAAMAGIDYLKNENPDTIASYIADAIKDVTDDIGDLSNLTTTAKTTIVAAINELDSAVGTLETGSSITVEESTPAGVLKRYTIKQGGTAVTGGTIDIPKDLVVSSGAVVQVTREVENEGEANEEVVYKIGDDVTTDAYITGENGGAGTYLKLVIANQTDPVFIKANDLVDVYTAAANATQVQLAISSNEISASIVAGSVTSTELASNAVTTAKITDENVTKAKLASAVQTSLGKADSAVQSVAEGSTNGTVAVDGTDVAVHGLGTAAYTASSAYDAAGAASTAESNAKAYADTALTWGTVPEATPAEPEP